MAIVKNPKASRIGESPYATEFIEVDLFDAIERYVEAKIACSNGHADCDDELNRMDSESVLRSVLQLVEPR